MHTVIFSSFTEYRWKVSRAPCSSKFVTISLNRATTCTHPRSMPWCIVRLSRGGKLMTGNKTKVGKVYAITEDQFAPHKLSYCVCSYNDTRTLTTPNFSPSVFVSDPISRLCPAAAADAATRRRAPRALTASAAWGPARDETATPKQVN